MERDRSPVTVGELIDALATYPPDDELVTSENGAGGGDLWVCLGPRDRVRVWSGWHTDPPVRLEDQ